MQQLPLVLARQWPAMIAYPYKHSRTARRQLLFAPNTPHYRLLSSTSDGSMGVPNQRASEVLQMPCLLYINAVMMEYATRPYLIDDFFCKLVNTVYEDNLDTYNSPEQLYIRLLQGVDDADTGRDKRLYHVTRLAYVARRLGKRSMEKARSALLGNLVLSDGLWRKERLFSRDPVVLEAEIMRE